MAVLAVNLTTWTLSLNMTGQILSLYHLPTLIGTLHFLKLTTITVTKVIVDVIQFTLPLTTFLLVSTVYMKTLNLSVKLFVWKCHKFFITTNWTSISGRSSFFDIVQTRLTEDVSTTHTQVRISTGKVTYFTYETVWRLTDEIIIISAIVVGRGCHVHMPIISLPPEVITCVM